MRAQLLNTKPFFHGLIIFYWAFFHFCLMKKSEFLKVSLYLFLDQLMHFIPGIASDTPFRGIISAILHFNFLGFKPAKRKKFFFKNLSLPLLQTLLSLNKKIFWGQKCVVFFLSRIFRIVLMACSMLAKFKNIRRAKILFFAWQFSWKFYEWFLPVWEKNEIFSDLKS